MKSALDFLRADPSVATSFKDAARIVDECAADLRESNDAAAIASVPIAADLLRVRALLAQKKAATRLTLAETNELARVIRDGIALLATNHAQRPTYFTLLGFLKEQQIGFEECGAGRIEVPYVDVHELVNLGSFFAQHLPQEQLRLIDTMQHDAKRRCVFWVFEDEQREAA